ncbi:UDP-glucose/GDP-mannose dehydrogenase family protein [Bacteroidales bacterium OttesenSCG-928-B11]|nr:UDP-glucose/GDP-mannose dehydrogenase family protein [Bacteroidales bacterium OttesenSCG-928-C03]MDL2312251.1 UDP-glucose/GDP-mannose dehydrogenase family protein [Bacteroidales bacterium OttesenSCG-928-B11]
MKIAIVGTGYVGLVTATCLAEVGFDLICVDIDMQKIETIEKGESPIYEPGLGDMLKRNIEKKRMTFTTSLAEVMPEVDVIFSAVGTPPDEDGSADLQYVLDVARTVGQNMQKYVLMITKSTVPVGTAEKVRKTVQDELDKRGVEIDFDVASNPEFLKEGDAINDFMKPDRIVCGADTEKARDIFRKIYNPFVLNGYPLFFTDIASAEMIKYAANAMLATRISFMNDVANLCEIVGADIDMVKKGIGADSRIGSKFLNAGVGYGGSCFPKDVKALIKTADNHGYSMEVLKAVENVNDRQKTILFDKLMDFYNHNLEGKVITLLGLAFKPNTDDMREASSLAMIEKLSTQKCTIKTYDPIAMPEAQRRIGNEVLYCNDLYDALEDSDALLLITEWTEFRVLDMDKVKKVMRNPVIFDGRNIYNGEEVKAAGIPYFRIGKQA